MLAFYKHIKKTDKEKIRTSAPLPKELQVATMKSESYLRFSPPDERYEMDPFISP